MKNRLPVKPQRQLLLLTALFAFFAGIAQSPLRNPAPPGCGTIIQKEGVYKTAYEAFEKGIAQKRLQRMTLRPTAGGTYTLPVVFHIIHQNGPENITEATIKNTLNQLNDAFANRNGYNKADGVDVGIRFCMAQQAPDGTMKMGLTRNESMLTNMIIEQDDATLKKIIQWDPNTYINIWVVNSITSSTDGPGVAGYANLPSRHGAETDGIVIEAGYLSGDANAAKVLVHEMGHYLGLYHTFEGGCKNDDCTKEGDRVCDTPPDGSVAAVACGTAVNTCTTDGNDKSNNNPFRPVSMGGLGDQPDMTRNYLDYGQTQCQDKFTEGQLQRMVDALTTARASLLIHTNICAECNTPLAATINTPDIVAAGTPVVFSLTLNDPAALVSWVIDGQAYTNQQTVLLTFHQSKTIQVAATATNGNPGCFAQVQKYIAVTCSVNPEFTASPDDLVSPGETISFNSTNTGSLTWKVDGAVVGTGPQYNYLVPDNKSRLVTLLIDNGTCATESEPYFVRPDNCKEDKSNNTWFFGQWAGIDFNVRPAKPIQGYVNTMECSAVLSDEQGRPMFHSNGETVFSSPMPIRLLNGNGLTANESTAQGAMFVPWPGSDRYIYLFTVAVQAGELNVSNGGVSYSIIDRQADNGRGDLIKKNIEILPASLEALTAVKNKKGDGLWVIAHEWESDAYYSWLISDTGISAKPVISHTGTKIYTAPIAQGRSYAAIGLLTATATGSRIAMSNGGWKWYEVSDFNNETGVISNTIQLHNPANDVYGVAFSPNERYLYGTSNSPANLVRYDLQAGNATAIDNTAQVIYRSPIGGGGSVQVGPDGKMYVILNTSSTWVSVINNPNAEKINEVGFVLKGIEVLANARCWLGFPTQVQSVYSVKPVIYGPTRVCRTIADTLVQYSFTKKGRATYTWSHKGINQFTAFTDTTVTMRITANGIDTVILSRAANCGTLYDTLYVSSGNTISTFIGNDTTVCPETELLKEAAPGFDTYRWSTGDTTSTISTKQEGWLWVDITSKTGCSYRDSALIKWRYLPELNLGNDTSICTAIHYTLQAPAGLAGYYWSDGSTGSSLTISDSGTYKVKVYSNNCYYLDTIRVLKGVPQQAFASDTVRVCNMNGYTTLNAPPGMTAYHWIMPNGTDTVAISLDTYTKGWHKIIYTNNCGTGEDSVYVYIPMVLPESKMYTCGDTLQITPLIECKAVAGLNQGNYYKMAANGKDIKFYGSNLYFLFGKDDNGCEAIQMVDIQIGRAFTKPPMTLELGADTAVCGGIVIALDAGTGFDTYRWSNMSYEQTTTAYNPGLYKVTANYCGYTWEDSIRITAKTNCPTAPGGGDPGGNDTCNLPFKLKPNPGTYYVSLYSTCSWISNRMLAMRVLSMDGKELKRVYGTIDMLSTALNRLMPSLASATYIIDLQCPFCTDIKQQLKWQIIR